MQWQVYKFQSQVESISTDHLIKVKSILQRFSWKALQRTQRNPQLLCTLQGFPVRPIVSCLKFWCVFVTWSQWFFLGEISFSPINLLRLLMDNWLDSRCGRQTWWRVRWEGQCAGRCANVHWDQETHLLRARDCTKTDGKEAQTPNLHLNFKLLRWLSMTMLWDMLRWSGPIDIWCLCHESWWREMFSL